MPRQMTNILTLLSALALSACTSASNVDETVMERHEEVSGLLLKNSFSDLKALEGFLDGEGVKYLIEEDVILKEPPENREADWDETGSMYYLVLLPRNPTKLYRFRLYFTSGRPLHIEPDYGYKNPY